MSRVIGDKEILHRLRKVCIEDSTYSQGGLDLSDMVEVCELLGISSAGNRSVLRKKLCGSLYIDRKYEEDEEETLWDDEIPSVKHTSAQRKDVPDSWEDEVPTVRAQRAETPNNWEDEFEQIPSAKVQQRAQPADVPNRVRTGAQKSKNSNSNRSKWIARLVKQVTEIVMNNINAVATSPYRQIPVFNYTYPPHYNAFYIEPGKTRADGIPYFLLIEGNDDSISKGKKTVMNLLNEALKGTPNSVVLAKSHNGGTDIVLIRG